MLDMISCEKFGDEEYAFEVCCNGWGDKDKIVVYSFGIGEDLSFSAHLSKRWKQCEIFAFDPTPKSIRYVEHYDKDFFNKFSFFPIGLSDKNGIVDFYLPQNPEYVSGSEVDNPFVNKSNAVKVQMHTLDYIMTMLRHDNIDLLKMDIEGSEFTVIPYILNNGLSEKIQQICVEIHNRFYKNGEVRLSGLLKQMASNGYKLINISQTKEEMTFIRI